MMTDTKHVIVVALGSELSDEVREYVWTLVNKGMCVDFFIESPASWGDADRERWEVLASHPQVIIRQLHDAPRRSPGSERTKVHRLFMRGLRIFQPWRMARTFRKRLRSTDFSDADKIVAADMFGLTLAWHLARQYPGIPATRSLDLS